MDLHGNGVSASIGYNSRMQLASLAYTKQSTKLLDLSYSYTGHANGGNNGQITGITDYTGGPTGPEAGRNVSYTYDGWARLKTAQTTGSTQYPAWGLSWTYDRYGNRKQQTVTAGSGPSSSLTINAANNRITDTGYSYDAAGNMTADGLNTMAYDGENRVATSTTNGVTTTSTYDGAGLRVKKQVGAGTATVYIFSGTTVIAEYAAGAGAGSPTREYIYSGGALVATLEGSTTKYHHADHLSMRVTSDTSGTKIADSGHYPFGENWYESGGANKLKFTSYERDLGANESQNDYAVFRTYINRLGRFNRPDPIAGSISDPQSLNRYAYTRNDPINLVDPLGLDWICLEYAWFSNGEEIPDTAHYHCFFIPTGNGQGDGSGGNRQREGEGEEPTSAALKKLQELLSKDPRCLAFLNSRAVDALSTLADLINYDLVGQAYIPPRESPDGSISVTNAQTPGTEVGQAITVNTVGAFFKESYNGRGLSANRGKITGGTQAARLFILLHELAHITGVLEPDRNRQAAIDRNDKKIEKNCKQTIQGFPK